MISVPAELELYVDAFAARLQAVVRGRAARVLYWLELVARDENAVTLQRVFRGASVHIAFTLLRQRVTLTQSRTRGHLCRLRRYLSAKCKSRAERHAAAAFLQRSFRRSCAEWRLALEVGAAVSLQAASRRFISVRRETHRSLAVGAAIAIQAQCRRRWTQRQLLAAQPFVAAAPAPSDLIRDDSDESTLLAALQLLQHFGSSTPGMFYADDKGEERGPFTSATWSSWIALDLLPPELLVRCGDHGLFLPLCDFRSYFPATPTAKSCSAVLAKAQSFAHARIAS